MTANCRVILRFDSDGFRMIECLWVVNSFLTLGSYMKLEGWSGILSNMVLSFGRLDRPWGSHLRLSLFSSRVIDGFLQDDFENSFGWITL